MSKFSDRFHLNPDELELIENSLRQLMHMYSDDIHHDAHHEHHHKVRSLNELLGKLHNQKIFYSQVNRTGVPAG